MGSEKQCRLRDSACHFAASTYGKIIKRKGRPATTGLSPYVFVYGTYITLSYC